MTAAAAAKETSSELIKIEQLAVELADIAGSEIVKALGGLLAIRYKASATAEADAEKLKWRDPVSEVDGRVEAIIRKRVAEHFPGHDIIGEEMTERPARDHEYVWAVDPIDGTTNFINGFPLFAASIGVLHRCRPVAAAVWCSTSHALRSGVYHAARGGKLRFDGADVTPKINPGVRRRLAGVPLVTGEEAHWDTRKTGSAALECALVAAGLLQVARFNTPNIWDVAGGIALVEAAGGEVRRHDGKRWKSMDSFEPGRGPDGKPDLRYWRGGIVVGRGDAVATMCAAQSGVLAGRATR
jgi:myo-inositol-1(or 4)-monophosphatase